MKNGIELITKERWEQVTKHGYTIENDAERNSENQLAFAASLLCWPGKEDVTELGTPQGWSEKAWKRLTRKSFKERLVIAGALIAAQLDLILQTEESEQ